MSEPALVNRTAVVLLPGEKFLAWVKTCPDADASVTLEEVQREPVVYLFPEDDNLDDHLRRHGPRLLADELAAWCPAEQFWPNDRSFRTFRDFFDVKVASMVFDMGEGDVVGEDR